MSRARSLPFVRLSLLFASILGLALLVAVDSRPRNAGADPAFGTVRPSPASGVVIEGHVFSVPIQMTTCADNATPISGTATSGSGTTLVHSGAGWTTNQWAGYDIQLTAGTSSPQWRIVASNTSSTITVSEAWGGVQDTGTATGGSTTTLVDTGSNWLTNEFAGMTLEMPALGVGQARTITSNTADTITVPSWTTLVAQTAAADTTPLELGATSLTRVGSGWTTNAYANKTVQIMSGPASGQSRRIVSNNSTRLTIEGTWTAATGGTLTGGSTSTVLVDVTKNWTVNAFAGMTLDVLTGSQAGQSRTISSNTATTITISPALTGANGGAPLIGDAYRVEQVPTSASQYLVREGPAIGTSFQVKQSAPPAAGTGYQLFKSACRVGGYDINLAYNNTKLAIASDAGFSSGSNTSTTFNDTSKVAVLDSGVNATGSHTSTTLKDTAKSWTVNQWAGKTVVLTGGTGSPQSRFIISNTSNTLTISSSWAPMPDATTDYDIQLSGWKINQWAGSRILIVGGTGTSQNRYIVSNTASQLVVAPAWSIPIPNASSIYQVGGITSSNFVENAGRTVTCPSGGVYGVSDVELHCASYGAPGTGLPQGPTGVGNLVNVTFLATGRGVSTLTLTGQVLEVDSAVIPADILNATRRVIICPDSASPPNGDGLINSGDFGLTAQAYGHTPTTPAPPNNKYTPQKDPNEDLVINSGDFGTMAAVFGKRCIQP